MRADTRKPRAPSVPWTKANDARLCELWLAGASGKAMATTLGRSEPAVNSRAKYLREHGHDLPLRNPAGAVRGEGWVQRRGLAQKARS